VIVSTSSRRRPAALALSTLALGALTLAGCTGTVPGGAGVAPPAAGGDGGAGVAAPPPAPAGACAPVEVLAARGTGEPQQTGSFIMGGLTNGIARQTGGTKYEVRYPASTDYFNDPNRGAADALARIQSQAAACPNQLFVLNGYSAGALVMVNLMTRIPAELQPRVVAAVLYGNPAYRSTSPAAAGTGKGAANGVMPFGGVPASFADKTRDYCNAGDPVCGAGANGVAHVGYGAYQAEGIAFAVEKVRAAQAG
jgi:cutinase